MTTLDKIVSVQWCEQLDDRLDMWDRERGRRPSAYAWLHDTWRIDASIY